MIWLLILLLVVAVCVLAFFWLDTRAELSLARSKHQAERATCAKHCRALNHAHERLHAVADSSLLGHPLVRWRHPDPTPAADAWYWRARFEGKEALFTDEALVTALERGRPHLSKPHSVSTTDS